MEKFTDLLQGVANKLGFTIFYLWPKAVLYTVVEAICGIIGWSIFGGSVLLVSRYMLKQVKRRKEEGGYEREVTGLLHVVAIILILLGSSIIIAGVTSNIPALFSPEWATVKGMLPK